MQIRTKVELGALVRGERERQDMTQQDLAERVGVRRLWITQLENGKGNTTIDPLLRCFDVLGLGLSVDQITDSSESRATLDQIIARSQGLSNE